MKVFSTTHVQKLYQKLNCHKKSFQIQKNRTLPRNNQKKYLV